MSTMDIKEIHCRIDDIEKKLVADRANLFLKKMLIKKYIRPHIGRFLLPIVGFMFGLTRNMTIITAFTAYVRFRLINWTRSQIVKGLHTIFIR